MTIINPNTLFIGKNFVFLEKCDSTNSYALDVLSSDNIAEGTIIYTDDQFGGKGQKGNIWVSEPKKNLTFSLVLMPKKLTPSQQFYITKLVSVTIVELLNDVISEGFEIKWPNDIYYNSKKVGGILIENSITKNAIQHSIIGIGLNINQDDFPFENATSIKQILGKEFSVKTLLELFCQSLEANYLKFTSNHKCFDRSYLDFLFRRGDISKFEDEISVFNAEIIGVDEVGMLMLKTNERLKTYNLKEIKFIL